MYPVVYAGYTFKKRREEKNRKSSMGGGMGMSRRVVATEQVCISPARRALECTVPQQPSGCVISEICHLYWTSTKKPETADVSDPRYLVR